MRLRRSFSVARRPGESRAARVLWPWTRNVYQDVPSVQHHGTLQAPVIMDESRFCAVVPRFIRLRIENTHCVGVGGLVFQECSEVEILVLGTSLRFTAIGVYRGVLVGTERYTRRRGCMQIVCVNVPK